MAKKYWILVGLLTLGSLAGIQWMLRSKQEYTESNRNHAASRRARGIQKKKDILRQSRSDFQDKVKSSLGATSSISKECRIFQSDIVGWKAQELYDGRYDLIDSSKCFEGKGVQDLAKQFRTSCQKKFTNKGEEPDPAFNQCLEEFFMLRAWVVSRAYKNTPPSSLTDVRLVMDLLLGAFSDRDFDRMIEAADQLVKLEPDLYEAHKARVTARFIQTHMSEENSSPNWEILDGIIKDLESFDVNDPELLDVIAMVRSRAGQDQNAMKELVEEFYENPNSRPYAIYLEAGSYRKPASQWTLVQADQALAKLDEAIHLAPNEQKFLNTRTELLKIQSDLRAGKKSTASPFSFNFGFRFDID